MAINNSKLKKNIITGFGGQLVIMILGIVVPRIMILSYGSDANGLLSTVSQIFTYMALLEAGIGQAAKNALYKPIIENNLEEISHIASIARLYFRTITKYYGIGVIAIAVAAPFVIKTNISHTTVSLIILFEGMSGVVSFYFCQTETVLLFADGRGYINNAIALVNKFLSYTAKIILAYLGANLILLELVYFILTVLRVIVYNLYFRKHYSYLRFDKCTKEEKLEDRNSYIVSEIAWTMFSSTDMIVLSVFVSTQLSSVYGVYNMIFVSLNTLLNAVYSSVNYSLGQEYHSDVIKYEKKHDAYTSLFFGAMTALMSVAYILIIPFVTLYTKGVSDISYVNSSLPIMFCLVQLISWSRYISGNLTAVAGYAKNTAKVSLIEASTNIILSILLVNIYGIVGVLFATVIALPLKALYCTYLSDIVILKRKLTKSIIIIGANFALFFFVVLVSGLFHLNITTYVGLFIHGIVISLVVFTVCFIVNILVNPVLYKMIRQRFVRK